MHPYLRKHSVVVAHKSPGPHIQKLPPRCPATSLLRERPKSNVANTHRLHQKPTPDRHSRPYSEWSEDILHVRHLKARSYLGCAGSSLELLSTQVQSIIECVKKVVSPPTQAPSKIS